MFTCNPGMLFAVLLVMTLLAFGVCGITNRRPNVLFLVADDMRPELGSYMGSDFPSSVHPRMTSPHLDALAARSLLLKRAYVQQAVCSPSRTSLLTGRRPDTTHVYDLVKYFRKVGGNFTTLPQYFKQNGYRSIGMGKIFHPGVASGGDDPISWSDPYFQPQTPYWTNHIRDRSWFAVPASLRAKYPLPDTLIKDHAVHTLKQVAKSSTSRDDPFFVAVGFHKPHLPFIFPEELLSLYPEKDIHVPRDEKAPINMPPIAWSGSGELKSYHDIKKLAWHGAINSSLPSHIVRELRRAYYSALSFTDSLIGEVLEALDASGVANNTIVTFWGDHGWQLGEHGEWCKQTNFELATHAPMMIHVPGLTDKGIVTERLAEFVDLFPTLAEVAGLPLVPLCPSNSTDVRLCTEGTSLVPLMREPLRSWKQAAFSQYPRGGNIMGYSMRTDNYRLTEWVSFDYNTFKPNWKHTVGLELYDHVIDPDENVNKAEDPAYINLVTDLRLSLRRGWREAQPNRLHD